MIAALTYISPLVDMIHSNLDLIIDRLDNPTGDLAGDLEFMRARLSTMNGAAMVIIERLNNTGQAMLPGAFTIMVDGFDILGRALYLNDSTIFTVDFIELASRLQACVVRLRVIIDTVLSWNTNSVLPFNGFLPYVRDALIEVSRWCISYLIIRGLGGPPGPCR